MLNDNVEQVADRVQGLTETRRTEARACEQKHRNLTSKESVLLYANK